MNFGNLKGLWRSVPFLASLSLCVLGSQSAGAQCLSGLGVPASVLSTQTWPRSFAPAQFTSFTLTHLVGDQVETETIPFKDVTSVTTDGKGHVFVMDAGAHQLYLFTSPDTASLGYKDSFNLSSAAFPLGQVPTAVYYAGGTVWGVMPDHSIAYLLVDEGSGIYVATGAISSTGSIRPYSVLSLPTLGTVTGATFDGQYVWFTTTEGEMIIVVPPVYKSTTVAGPASIKPPTVRNTLNVSNFPLNAPIFDGNTVWTTGRQDLLGVDAKTLNSPPMQAFGGTVSNVVFDGVFLWVAEASGEIVKYDPVARQINSSWPATFGDLVYTGRNVATYGSARTALYRACDAHQLGSGPPAMSAVFDGSHIWTADGTGLLIW